MRFAKVTLLGFVAVVALACTSVSIPTIPPIPTGGLPSGFPFPSGLPFPSGVIPIPSASGTCAFMTAQEVGQLWGSAATLTDTSNGDCSFTFSNFSTINISTESNTDLAGSRVLFGATAKDITVAGLPAISGVFIGQPAVYVQKGANQLQILGILTGSDDATVAKLVQVATLAVSRWPG
jgi:hypothetical protein